MKSMKRTVSLVLVLAMLCTALLGVTSFAEATETETPKLVISQANLQFADTVYLLIAVDYTAVYDTLDEAKAAVTLNVKNTAIESSEIVNLKPDSGITLAGHVCFVYKDLGAKNMGDELELTAVNGTNDSVSKTFSVLEYALKAKGISDTLDAVCDTMIAYGEAAQTVWGWKDKATYDLSKDWGIVLFGGTTASKQIAEAGSTISAPAADSALGSSAVLYSADFKKVSDAITVKEGVSRYFYLGSNLTDYNLDFTTGNIATGTVLINGLTVTTKAAKKAMYSTIAGGASLTSTAGSKTWTLNSSDDKTSTDYASIIEVDGEKCLQWQIDDKSDQGNGATGGSGQINGTNGLPTGGKTVYTISFTIGKVAGKKLIGGPRFRGTVNGNVYFWTQNGDNGIKLWDKSELAVSFEDGEFKTIHMVVDPASNKISCYVDSNFLGDYVPTGNNKTILATSTSYRLDWTTFDGGAQMNIKRAVVTMGDIFKSN